MPERSSTIIHNACELMNAAPENRDMYFLSREHMGRPAADLALVLSISDLFSRLADQVDPRHVAAVAFVITAFWNEDRESLRYGHMFVANDTDRTLLADLQQGTLPKVPKVIFAAGPDHRPKIVH